MIHFNYFFAGVEAPKQVKVTEEPAELGEMPKWLEIKPTGALI